MASKRAQSPYIFDQTDLGCARLVLFRQVIHPIHNDILAKSPAQYLRSPSTSPYTEKTRPPKFNVKRTNLANSAIINRAFVLFLDIR